MTNKPMLSVERDLLESCWAALMQKGQVIKALELRALLDKSPTGWLPCSPNLLESGVDCATSPRWSSKEWGGHSHWHPSPIADHTQCEECKGWGYHENHHEGGGTECGECGGSGNATVAVAVVKPDVDELAQIIRKVDGSHTLGAGSLAEAILEEVARLNGVKP